MTTMKESKALLLLQKNGVTQHKCCSIRKSQVIAVFRDATTLYQGYAIYFKELYQDDSVTHSSNIHKHRLYLMVVTTLFTSCGVGVF